MHYKVQVLLLGIEGAGKSAFLKRLIHHGFTPEHKKTIGIDFHVHDVEREHPGGNDDIKLQIYDASGAEKYHTLVKPFFKTSDIYCVFIDPTVDLQNQKENFETLFTSMEKKSSFKFIITKSDLVTLAELTAVQQQLEMYLQMLRAAHQLKIKTYVTTAKNLTETAGYRLFLNECIDAAIELKHIPQLESLFRTFSKGVALDGDDEDRSDAVTVFEEQLQRPDIDINRIDALVKVAEPYINRHRHPLFDNTIKRLFGRVNTESWNACLLQARTRALQLLSQETGTPDCTKANLIFWKTQSLFATHRNSSVLKGAFGQTHAQHEIDRLIRQVP